MSLILSGSDGLSDVDGSAATPAIRGTDANTGIFFPAADTIAFSEGGVEAARFNSSGQLCIGTTSATQLINIGAGVGVNAGIEIAGNGNTVGTTSIFVGQGSDSTGYVYQRANSSLILGTNNTQRASIGSTGGLAIANGLAVGTNTIFTSSIFFAGGVLSAGAGTYPLKWNSGSGIVTYDTSSRLVKENIEDSPYGLAEVLQLKSRKYYRTDDQRNEIGFVADEVQGVMPEFVPMVEKSLFTKDEADTEMIAGGVNYEKLTSVLVKAIQEQQALITQLQADVAALKAR